MCGPIFSIEKLRCFKTVIPCIRPLVRRCGLLAIELRTLLSGILAVSELTFDLLSDRSTVGELLEKLTRRLSVLLDPG